MGAKACIVVGVICLLLGILLALGGPLLIPYEIPKQINDYLVVDSKSSQQFDDWAGGYDVKNNYQMVFYFFNLTNQDDVRQSAAIPEYTTQGPYIYRRYRHSENVTFPNGAKQVQFLDFRDYQYDIVASGGLSNTDIITNVNPVYFSAIAQAGSEQNMLVAAVGGVLPNITDYFTVPYADGFISAYTSMLIPNYLPELVNDKIALINETMKDTTNSTDFFLWAWCNATQKEFANWTDYGNWTGLALSYAGVRTNISRSSASDLLNPAIILSLVNTDIITSWAWDRALTNITYRQAICAKFDLTDAQFETVWWWRTKSFGPVFIYDFLKANFSVEDVGNIGWIQWTYGTVLGTAENPTSIWDIWPIIELGYLYITELFGSPASAIYQFPSWQYSQQVMNPYTGLENMTLYQAFALAMSQGATNYTSLGLGDQEAAVFFGYSVQLSASYVSPALTNLFGPTGGLTLTQSVDDWIFNCNPFLINLLLPSPPPCAILLNHTVFSNVTINSGKGNISEINQYVAWQGSPNVSGIWLEDLPVEGCTELGQFAPKQKKGGTLETFNDEFVRTMVLDYTNTTTLKGIDAYQYVLNYDNIFSPNDFYYQSIPGFTNMTIARQAPIFFSLWDMLYVNEAYREKVIGLNDTTTEMDDNTVIVVEPITGNTIQSHKRLQVNIYSPVNCSWCVSQPNQNSAFGNDNFPQDTFFPLAKAGEYIQISDDLASMLRGKLKEIHLAPRIGLYVGVSAGPALFLLGVVLVVCGVKRRNNSSTYESINDR